jgi:hypothetical protein
VDRHEKKGKDEKGRSVREGDGVRERGEMLRCYVAFQLSLSSHAFGTEF